MVCFTRIVSWCSPVIVVEKEKVSTSPVQESTPATQEGKKDEEIITEDTFSTQIEMSNADSESSKHKPCSGDRSVCALCFGILDTTYQVWVEPFTHSTIHAGNARIQSVLMYTFFKFIANIFFSIIG